MKKMCKSAKEKHTFYAKQATNFRKKDVYSFKIIVYKTYSTPQTVTVQKYLSVHTMPGYINLPSPGLNQ
jgi:hypothetical protein